MDSESGVTKFTRKFYRIPIKNFEIPRKMPDFTRAAIDLRKSAVGGAGSSPP